METILLGIYQALFEYLWNKVNSLLIITISLISQLKLKENSFPR
ncbi:hypothetical protein ADICYQ_1275 [Cyclobacterium qasimii M12-11B]|uniref:Uncharacterized protein n=1 Tax=Cyclobacterium qasimii M12-11B TaxID=641524 RepID=S7VGY0_9BACT|nr:hypothetical protein ADICYQ_1275 [Cyclobacterium qasimii M12-11B]